MTIKLNNQTNISANQTQIFTQINLYCVYNMCPKCARGNGAAGRQLEKSYVAPVVYAKCTPLYFVNNDLCMPEIYLVLSTCSRSQNWIKKPRVADRRGRSAKKSPEGEQPDGRAGCTKDTPGVVDRPT